MSTAPRRVRVRHPRTDSAHRRGQPAGPKIGGRSALDEVSLATLIRAQRRLAVLTALLVVGALAGAAVLSSLAARAVRAHHLGAPLAWLVLGVLVYPVLILIGGCAVRRAERNEQAFRRLVSNR